MMLLPQRRIGIFGFFHESHSFLSATTGEHDFRWRHGAQMLATDASPQITGFADGVADINAEAVPLLDVRAPPGGPVAAGITEAVLDSLDRELEAAGPLDALLVGLHGAMLTGDVPDLDGHVLIRLRERVCLARVPIGGSLDLHANFSNDMACHANALVGYRENPHTDVRETSRRSVHLVGELLNGTRLTTVWAHSGVILAPSQTATADEPMRGLLEMAQGIEERCSSVRCVNVFGGYAYADSECTGLSVSAVTAGDPELARMELQRLVDHAAKVARVSPAPALELDEALTSIVTTSSSNGPVLIVEAADNIGAGAPGDCTAVVRGLIRHRIGGSAAVINDPEAAQVCAAAGIGASISISIGGKGYSGDPGPVALTGVVERVTDGRFDLDHSSHMAASRGTRIDMGLTALFRCDAGPIVLITSRRTPPNDLGQWRSQGVEPRSLRVIVVKAAVAHRHAYEAISEREVRVATPGPCPSDIRQLPYKRVRRPVFPLDY